MPAKSFFRVPSVVSSPFWVTGGVLPAIYLRIAQGGRCRRNAAAPVAV